MTIEEECMRLDLIRTASQLEINLDLLDEQDDPVIQGTTRELALHYHDISNQWYHRQNLPNLGYK